MDTNPKTTPGIEPSGETEKVFATTEDDYGTSYYYRGAVDNNYVTFAGMCWRIVRVQGDGSIKITLYDEQNTCTESTSHGTEAFISQEGKGQTRLKIDYKNKSDSKADVKFVTSTAESTLRDWYGFEAIDLYKYEKDIETMAEWCNDVSEAETTEDGTIYFGAYKRLFSNNGNIPTGPSLKCRSLNDENDESIYEGKIGLLSADELALAGAPVGAVSSRAVSTSFYLADRVKTAPIWTISPVIFDSSANVAVFWLGNNVQFKEVNFSTTGPLLDAYSVEPTIVLKNGVKVTDSGTGKIESPFTVE